MHFAANFVVQEQESWSAAQEDRSGLSMSKTLPEIQLPVEELSDGLDPRILPLCEKNVCDGRDCGVGGGRFARGDVLFSPLFAFSLLRSFLRHRAILTSQSFQSFSHRDGLMRRTYKR